MSSNASENAEKTKREGHRRKGRALGALFALCMGGISFFRVFGSPGFETMRTIDVLGLMIAGASLGVALVLLIWFFESPRAR